MKKTYINPELVVVELQITQQIMAGSPKLGDGYYDPNKPVFAPGMDLDDELDEFEDY